jgi:eukaryotic-like serine/threonine-protein kinase
LFYVVGIGVDRPSSLVWVDRDGNAEPIPTIQPRRFIGPRLSFDEKRVLVVADNDVRVYELMTGRESRLTSDGSVGGFAEWRGDGTVAYTSARSQSDGMTNVWIHSPDGNATRLTSLDGQVDVDCWAPDGRTLAVHHHKPGGGTDVLMIPIADGQRSEPWPFVTGLRAVFSPDGRYVAYLSSETGQPEVYVRPFPGPGSTTPVSVGGAVNLAWARNGELFYRRVADNALIAVPVATTPTLSVGQPQELFRFAGLFYNVSATTYAVSGDGKRFLMSAGQLESGSAARPAAHIVQNWTEELKARVP